MRCRLGLWRVFICQPSGVFIYKKGEWNLQASVFVGVCTSESSYSGSSTQRSMLSN